MAQFASDAFTGADATELSTYSASWAKPTGASGNARLISNRLRQTNATSSWYYHSGSPASADYSVNVDVYNPSGGGGLTAAGPTARQSTGELTAYHARLNASGPTLQLYKAVAGAFTLLGSSTAFTEPATGAAKNLKLDVVGTSISLYWDGSGTPHVSQTDSAISSAGQAGLRFSTTGTPSDTSGYQLDNFSADDPASGVTITANIGAAVGAGVNAGIASPITVSASTGAATAAGLSAGIASPIAVAASAGAAAGAGLAAVVASPINVAARVGAASAAGLSASVSAGTTIAAGVGTAVGAGLSAGVASPITVAAGAGAATGAGLQASISTGTEITAGVGVAAGAGLLATVSSPQTISASTGAASAAGLAGNVASGITIPAGIGAASALGLTATVTAVTHIVAGVGAASASGLDATITATTTAVGVRGGKRRLDTSQRRRTDTASRATRV